MGKQSAAAPLAKQGRNAEIDFYRLVMTLVVIFHHSRYLTDPAWMEAPFPGGYLPVEFFFILTGYFAVRTVMKSPEASYEDIPRWMWKKFVPILKFDLAIGVVHRLMYSAIVKMPLIIAVKELIKSVYDLLFLRMAGFVSEQAVQYNQSNWYLSAIFLVLPFFFAAMIMNKKLMFGLIAPLSPILIYGYQVSNGISLATGTLIRTWGGVCLGAVAYAITDKLEKVHFTKKGGFMLSFVELAALVCTLLYMLFYGWDRLDYVAVALFLVVITIAMSKKASISKLYPACVSRIQDFVLALYLGQTTVGALFIPWLRTRLPWMESITVQLCFYVALCLLYALVWTVLIRLWDRVALSRKLMKTIASI